MRKLYEHYVGQGVMVSGIITKEARIDGERTGFKIRSLISGVEGWLATKAAGAGPRVGSYTVNIPDLEKIGAASLQHAARGDAPLVLIDEVGPMEMTSETFRHSLLEVFKSGKTTVASVKYGSHYQEVEQVSKLGESRTIVISRENRDSLLPQLTAIIDGATDR